MTVINKLWFKSVSLEDNEDYVLKLCKKFNIEKYSVVYNDGQLVLLFEYGIDSYKCIIDDYEKRLILLKRNKVRNFKQKEFYHTLKKFDGHDCWYDMFKFIAKHEVIL